MKGNTKTFSLYAYPLFLMVAVAVTYATPQGPGGQLFSITIGTDSDVVKAGTDVTLRVSLQNTTDHEIRLTTPRAEGQAELVLDVEVRRDNGLLAQETKNYRDLQYYRDLNAQPVGRRESQPVGPTHKVKIPDIEVMSRTLTAGDAWDGRLFVNKFYDLSEPGTYTIRVRYHGPDTKADTKSVPQSNAITVTVNP
jgi:hypothetical protein